MNLKEALRKAKEGNFVTNEYFSQDQSLHYYKGKYYYEDGAIVSREFLESQNFAINGKWDICAKKENIDFEKLEKMHTDNMGYTIIGGDLYSVCINKKEEKYEAI